MVIIRRNLYNPEKEVITAVQDNTGSHKYNGCYGVAADIGTTTISASLFALDSGKYYRNITETNSQVKFGADVMMRIMNSVMGKAGILHGIIIEQVENIIERLSSGICSMDKIIKMSVAGNTTMCHIFLGRDLSGMSGAPFKAAYSGSASITGKEAGFKKCPGIDIYVLPGIAAHTGADAVAVICSQKLYRTDKVQLAVDIGTNAEIILNNKGRIYACSAAAGPAFEGKGVKCGIRACQGAINGIKINKLTGNIVLDVLDTEEYSNNKNLSRHTTKLPATDTGKYATNSMPPEELIPKGICGSGLADAISELLKVKVLKPDGYLMDYNEAMQSGVKASVAERLYRSSEGNYFVFYSKTGLSNKQHEIVVTQKDIRNIQLAKAAIQAAAEVLFTKAGILLKDVDEVKIAGVFGKFIHPGSAISFGLYPDIDTDRLHFIGNAAGNGAAQALFDNGFRELALKYSREAIHVELAQEKIFQEKFLNAMELKKW
ncbi:MAG: ASKHA domain-containing protein [Lachnospiraceae bacterium]